MRGPSLLALVALSAFALSACGPTRFYAWGKYDESLYAHYRKPAEREAHLERLQTLVQNNEAAGVKMPPGVYAEYGYALFEAGRPSEAVVCFEKERATWPESGILMAKLIRNVTRQTKPAEEAPTADASAAPAPKKEGAER